ncbi:MAG TPA: MBL fold metallo-hydrolase, partial [Chloroflexota bacterium]|nr:MBL fold metallo-hydrolase [Chloroflexota bacterium]
YHWATCPVDATLSDGEILPIGDLAFQALETPGHAIGHLSFLLPRPEGDVLFSGDSVFHGGKILLQAIPDCSLWDYRRSIARLRTLRVTTLLPGHQALVMREGQQHIAAAERAFAILLPPPNLV